MGTHKSSKKRTGEYKGLTIHQRRGHGKNIRGSQFIKDEGQGNIGDSQFIKEDDRGI